MSLNNPPIANTPIVYALKSLNPTMGVVHNMQVALAFEAADIEANRKNKLGVTDVSCFAKFGVKGPNAASWLMSQGLQVPAHHNTWLAHEGYMVLKLGASEFLVEDQYHNNTGQKLASFNQSATTGAYQVQRADAAFILSGSEVLNMLSELCMLDLRDSALPANAVLMTQIAGISATILRQQLNGEQVYRIWCDSTYGVYMWNILLEVASELGGGAVGLASYNK